MERLGRALDELAEAYRDARRLVFDRLPPGTEISDARLAEEQLQALRRFYAAESAVRFRDWASDPEPQGEEIA